MKFTSFKKLAAYYFTWQRFWLLVVGCLTVGAIAWYVNIRSLSFINETNQGNLTHNHSSQTVEHSHTNQDDQHASSHKMSHKASDEKVYTCPMHPQIRQPNPGRCPICGMELVLASQESSKMEGSHDGVIIEPVARRLAGIKTMMVEMRPLRKSIHAIGTISYDESRLAVISAYVSGRIEKLYADYTGVQVKKGDHLGVFYSPALYAAQVEYIQTLNSVEKLAGSSLGSAANVQRALLENARTKLSELGMSEKQIRQLSKTRQAKSRLEIFAPLGGTVIEKPSAPGQYVKAGETLFRIADLSTVWLTLDIFPEDASFIHYGQEVEAIVRSLPGKRFKGRVAFIDPVVQKQTRTIKVRVEMVNQFGALRPGDLAEATLDVPVALKGHQGKIFDPSLAGKFICPMHPQITDDKAGKCPVCGMDLVKAEKFGFVSSVDHEEELLVVPRNAVLRIGSKSVVFVEGENGVFSLRQVETGPVVEDQVVIVNGLKEFETIAVDGVFLLDSQMQLSGKMSLIDVSSSQQIKGTLNKVHQHHQH